MLACAAGYKTMHQEATAHSSREAEQGAMLQAAKMVLYFKSILEDLKLPQNNELVIFEDT
jgi:hypothetical protein